MADIDTQTQQGADAGQQPAPPAVQSPPGGIPQVTPPASARTKPAPAAGAGGDAQSPYSPAMNNLRQNMGTPRAPGGASEVPISELYDMSAPAPGAPVQEGIQNGPFGQATTNNNASLNQNFQVDVRLSTVAASWVSGADELLALVAAWAAAYQNPREHAAEFRLSPTAFEGIKASVQLFLAQRPHLVSETNSLLFLVGAHLAQLGIAVWEIRKLNLEIRAAEAAAAKMQAEAELARIQSKETDNKLALINAENRRMELMLQAQGGQPPVYVPATDEKKKGEVSIAQYQTPVAQQPQPVYPANQPRQGLSPVAPVPNTQQPASTNPHGRDVNSQAPSSPFRERSFATESHYITPKGWYKKSPVLNDKGKYAWKHVNVTEAAEIGETMQMYAGVRFMGDHNECPRDLLDIFFENRNNEYVGRSLEQIAGYVLQMKEGDVFAGKNESVIRSELANRASAARMSITRTRRLDIRATR